LNITITLQTTGENIMKKNLLLASLAALSFSASALETTISASELAFSGNNSDTIVVSIAGPENYNQQLTFNGSSASISVYDINSRTDGAYNFEVLATQKIGEESVSSDNGRNSTVKDVVSSETDSGHFSLVNGRIVTATEEAE